MSVDIGTHTSNMYTIASGGSFTLFCDPHRDFHPLQATAQTILQELSLSITHWPSLAGHTEFLPWCPHPSAPSCSPQALGPTFLFLSSPDTLLLLSIAAWWGKWLRNRNKFPVFRDPASNKQLCVFYWWNPKKTNTPWVWKLKLLIWVFSIAASTMPWPD